MRNKRLTVVLLIISSLVTSNTIVAVEISPGMMLSNSCAACHGTLGKSPGAIPSINGKSSNYIFEALQQFQTGARSSTVMGRHAKGYSEQELRLIADFFSNQ